MTAVKQYEKFRYECSMHVAPQLRLQPGCIVVHAFHCNYASGCNVLHVCYQRVQLYSVCRDSVESEQMPLSPNICYSDI